MTTTVLAHFDGKVFVPDEPVDMPVGTQLRVHVEAVGETAPPWAAPADAKVTPAPRRFQPLNIQIDPELSHAIALDPEFNIEESQAMPLDIPDGTRCFVDANIFHQALVPTFDTSPACLALVDRAMTGLISISVSIQVLGDALHKAMMSEAAQLAGRKRAGIVGYLKRHPELIAQLTEWPQAVERLKTVPMQFLPTDAQLIDDAKSVAQTYGLLTNDAIIVALMQRHGITHLATNDDDFDRVPGITVRKPR